MKIIKTRTLIIDVDLEEERNRIRLCFKQKRYQKALIEVIDEFEKHGYKKACDAYDALPYHKKDEYDITTLQFGQFLIYSHIHYYLII